MLSTLFTKAKLNRLWYTGCPKCTVHVKSMSYRYQSHFEIPHESAKIVARAYLFITFFCCLSLSSFFTTFDMASVINLSSTQKI